MNCHWRHSRLQIWALCAFHDSGKHVRAHRCRFVHTVSPRHMRRPLGADTHLNRCRCRTLPQVAVQTVLSEADIPLGIGAAIFAQTIRQSIFASAVGDILNNQLVADFHRELPSINSMNILDGGTTRLQSTVDSHDLSIVRQIYNHAITRAFYTCVAAAGLSLLVACLMEWNSVKDEVGDESAVAAPKAEVVAKN